MKRKRDDNGNAALSSEIQNTFKPRKDSKEAANVVKAIRLIWQMSDLKVWALVRLVENMAMNILPGKPFVNSWLMGVSGKKQKIFPEFKSDTDIIHPQFQHELYKYNIGSREKARSGPSCCI